MVVLMQTSKPSSIQIHAAQLKLCLSFRLARAFEEVVDGENQSALLH
jgi:hypothetical protein